MADTPEYRAQRAATDVPNSNRPSMVGGPARMIYTDDERHVVLGSWSGNRLHLRSLDAPEIRDWVTGRIQREAICSPDTWGVDLDDARRLTLPMCKHCTRKAKRA